MKSIQLESDDLNLMKLFVALAETGSVTCAAAQVGLTQEAGRRMIEKAVRTGGIDQPDDIEVVLDVIYGPVFYRLLVGHQPLDEGFADHLVAGALRILG